MREFCQEEALQRAKTLEAVASIGVEPLKVVMAKWGVAYNTLAANHNNLVDCVERE